MAVFAACAVVGPRVVVVHLKILAPTDDLRFDPDPLAHERQHVVVELEPPAIVEPPVVQLC